MKKPRELLIHLIFSPLPARIPGWIPGPLFSSGERSDLKLDCSRVVGSAKRIETRWTVYSRIEGAWCLVPEIPLCRHLTEKERWENRGARRIAVRPPSYHLCLITVPQMVRRYEHKLIQVARRCRIGINHCASDFAFNGTGLVMNVSHGISGGIWSPIPEGTDDMLR